MATLTATTIRRKRSFPTTTKMRRKKYRRKSSTESNRFPLLRSSSVPPPSSATSCCSVTRKKASTMPWNTVFGATHFSWLRKWTRELTRVSCCGTFKLLVNWCFHFWFKLKLPKRKRLLRNKLIQTILLYFFSFANGMAVNDPLQTLYQLMSGRQPIAVKECADQVI